MTVRDFIKELLEYNLDAEMYVGNNLNNVPVLSYGGGEDCTKKNCDDVGIHIAGKENCENK